jgi:hypothetical protein
MIDNIACNKIVIDIELMIANKMDIKLIMVMYENVVFPTPLRTQFQNFNRL